MISEFKKRQKRVTYQIHQREEYIGKQDPGTSKVDYLLPHVGTSISLLQFSCYKLCWLLSQSQVVEPQPQVVLGQQNQPVIIVDVIVHDGSKTSVRTI